MRNYIKHLILILLLLLSSLDYSFSQNIDGDWFSENTLASVVKLGSVVTRYLVSGLPLDYKYSTKCGEIDFGDATVLEEETLFVHVGTGVVVTPDGLILSNAHVTEAYETPTIENFLGSDSNPLKDDNGEIIKEVIINKFPGYMFVGVSTTEAIKNRDERQHLSYVAKTIYVDKEYNTIRDRAVLKIVCFASLDENDIPILGDIVKDDFIISYVTMTNPFDISYIDNKVRAIGFPGNGDPDRASKTSGELLGYESDKQSIILHTNWISNGNSGGGLFYKDKLIGINTWDNHENSARPIGEAQPITYWGKCFSQLHWFSPNLQLPEFSSEWIKSDPSTESYKNTANIALSIVSESDKTKPVETGTIVIFRNDISLDDINIYQEYEYTFNICIQVVKAFYQNRIEEVKKRFDLSDDFIKELKNVRSINDLRQHLTAEVLPYFDIWVANSFYYSIYNPEEKSGKVFITVPQNSVINIAYLNEKGAVNNVYTLTVDNEYIQGPYTIPVRR